VKVSVIVNGRNLDLDSNCTWQKELFVQGFYPNTYLCTGVGRCGQCKLKFLKQTPEPTVKDQDVLGPEELAQGIRLGCEHQPKSGQEVEVLSQVQGVLDQVKTDLQTFGIDLGTTSLKWGGFSKENEFLLLGKRINPQMGAGAEVISRIGFALESLSNKEYLQKVIRKQIQEISLEVWAKSYGLTGNSVMIYLLLGQDLTGLSAYPFVLSFEGNDWIELGAKRYYIPPLLAPFVGADVSAGLVYLEKEIRPAYPYLFCDFGTNGELVLVKNEEQFFCTSVALGPALEGVGLRFGSVFAPGVVTKFFLSPHGLGWIGPKEGFKVSGSGYLSLVSLLLRTGLLDRFGHWTESGGRFKQLAKNLHDRKFYCAKDVYLDEQDIEEILKVKAAISAGTSLLLEKANLCWPELSGIYLSGALGVNFSKEDLIELGFFPLSSESKIRLFSDLALKGLNLILLKELELVPYCSCLKQKVSCFNLTDDKNFNKLFLTNMQFVFNGV